MNCTIHLRRGETQYLDPIIQATHTTDGAMIDICKSLGSCLREPKNIVSIVLPLLLFEVDYPFGSLYSA